MHLSEFSPVPAVNSDNNVTDSLEDARDGVKIEK